MRGVGRTRRGARRTALALAFAPSLAAGAIGLAWWGLAPPDRTPVWPLGPSVAAGLATGVLVLAAGEAATRFVPSFAYVARRTERALAQLRPSTPTAVALAVATSVGEEILFRGMLLATLGLGPQALLFGLAHPAGRRGWSYPVFTALAGLAFGALVAASGRLAPAITAHLVVNLVGLLRGVRAGRRAHRRTADGDADGDADGEADGDASD